MQNAESRIPQNSLTPVILDRSTTTYPPKTHSELGQPPETPRPLVSSTDMFQPTFVNACYDRARGLFNEFMLDALMKVAADGTNSLKVCLDMEFPSFRLVDCRMRVHISQEKVAYLAAALFQLEVEVIQKVRFIRLKNGSKMIPDPQLRLIGTSEEAIVAVLGSKICNAIKTCRMRTVESELGVGITDCVAMLLTSRSDEGATIILAMGVRAGYEFSNILYK